MNLDSANVVIRPRAAPESLDLTFPFLIRVGGLAYLGLCLLVLLPALAACVGLGVWLGWREAWIWLLAVPLGVWLQGVFTLAAGELMFARRLQARSVLRSFLRRLPAYTLGLLVSRVLLLLVASTVIFAPWAWSRFLFVPEMLLLEGLPLGASIQRASRFGKLRGGFALSIWISGALTYGVLASVALVDSLLHFTLQIPEFVPGSNLSLESLYALLGWFAMLPVVATLRFFRYVDGRTRSDGWDAQLKLQRMARGQEGA